MRGGDPCFLLILAVLLLAVGVPMFAHGYKNKSNDRYGYGSSWPAHTYWGNALQITGGVVLLVVIILNLVAYANQVGDQQSLTQYRQNEAIYAKKAAVLTSQFRGYLAEQYPKYEKSIFQTFERTPNLLFARYPELKTENSLMTLTGEINGLQSAVYQQQLNITQAEKNLRTRRANPFYLGFLLP